MKLANNPRKQRAQLRNLKHHQERQKTHLQDNKTNTPQNTTAYQTQHRPTANTRKQQIHHKDISRGRKGTSNNQRNAKSKQANGVHTARNARLAANLTFCDHYEEQIIQSRADTRKHGWGRTELYEDEHTYIYAIDIDQNNQHRSQFYHTLRIKPHIGPKELLGHIDQEEDYRNQNQKKRTKSIRKCVYKYINEINQK